MVLLHQLILTKGGKQKNDNKVEVFLKCIKNVLLKIKNDYYILSYHYHKEYV